jgi:hypothetical protein
VEILKVDIIEVERRIVVTRGWEEWRNGVDRGWLVGVGV